MLEDAQGLEVCILEQEIMNKNFTQNILGFLWLIFIAISLGCTQSVDIDSLTANSVNTITIQPSQTPASITAAATSTPISCVSFPQTANSDIEKIADEWFLSSQPLVTEREGYIFIDSWDRFCDDYKEAVFNQAYWINAPIELALHVTGYPHPEDLFPTSVYAVTMERRSDVMTVIILEADTRDDSVKAIESRINLIKVDRLGQIYWRGFRLRCRQSIDWVTESCS